MKIIRLYGACILGLFFVILAACSEDSSKNSTNGNDEEIQRLMNDALDLYDAGNYFESDLLFEKISKMVNSHTDTTLQIRLLFNKTESLRRAGKYEVSIKNYFDALTLASLIKDDMRIGLAHYNLSSVHFNLNDLRKAKDHNRKAIEKFTQIRDEERLNNAYVQLALIVKETDQKLSQTYMEKAIVYYDSIGNEVTLAICYNNYAEMLADAGEIEKSIETYQTAKNLAIKNKDEYMVAITLGNIAESYLELGNKDSVSHYLKRSNQVARSISSNETLLQNEQRYSRFYILTGKPDSAIIATEKAYDLIEDLTLLKTTDDLNYLEKFHRNRMELIQTKYKKKELEQDKKTRNQVIFFGVILLVLAVVIFLVIVNRQRKIIRITKSNREKDKKLLEKELHLIEQVSERLKSELQYKRKELMTFSMNLNENEKFIKTLEQKVSSLDGAPSDRNTINELKLILRNQQGTHSTEFYQRLESLEKSFRFELKNQFPILGDDDLKFAAFIFLKMSSKEIASVLNIEVKSVNMKRYRLKKKLGMDKNGDLEEFIYNLYSPDNQ